MCVNQHFSRAFKPTILWIPLRSSSNPPCPVPARGALIHYNDWDMNNDIFVADPSRAAPAFTSASTTLTLRARSAYRFVILCELWYELYLCFLENANAIYNGYNKKFEIKVDIRSDFISLKITIWANLFHPAAIPQHWFPRRPSFAAEGIPHFNDRQFWWQGWNFQVKWFAKESKVPGDVGL